MRWLSWLASNRPSFPPLPFSSLSSLLPFLSPWSGATFYELARVSYKVLLAGCWCWCWHYYWHSYSSLPVPTLSLFGQALHCYHHHHLHHNCTASHLTLACRSLSLPILSSVHRLDVSTHPVHFGFYSLRSLYQSTGFSKKSKRRRESSLEGGRASHCNGP